MGNLAMTYKDHERHADALAMFERALEFRRRVLPANHPHIGEGCEGVMGCMRCGGSYALFFRLDMVQHRYLLRDKRFPTSRAVVRA